MILPARHLRRTAFGAVQVSNPLAGWDTIFEDRRLCERHSIMCMHLSLLRMEPSSREERGKNL